MTQCKLELLRPKLSISFPAAWVSAEQGACFAIRKGTSHPREAQEKQAQPRSGTKGGGCSPTIPGPKTLGRHPKIGEEMQDDGLCVP